MATANSLNLSGTAGQVIAGTGADLPLAGVNSSTLGTGGVLLTTQTASSSAAVNFTSVISGSYSWYRVIGANIVVASANVNYLLEVSTNNGVSYDTTAGHYSYLQRAYALNSTNTGTTAGSTGSAAIQLMNAVNTTSTVSLILDILNPGTNFGSFKWVVQGINNTPVRQTVIGAGVYEQAATFNAFRLRFSSTTNTTTGTYKVYGYV